MALRQFEDLNRSPLRVTGMHLPTATVTILSLDILVAWAYIPLTFSTEGRSCRTLLKRGKGWRPRARLVTSHPGGPGAPIGGHYDPSARSSLDWDWPKRPRPRKRGPGDRNRHKRSAGRRARSRNAPPPKSAGADKAKADKADMRRNAPCGAPSPRFLRGRKWKPALRRRGAP